MKDDELLESIEGRAEAHNLIVSGVKQYHSLLETQEMIAGFQRTIAGYKEINKPAYLKAARGAIAACSNFNKYHGYTLLQKEMKHLHDLCKQGIDMLDKRPAELQRVFDKISNRDEKDLEGWDARALAASDKSLHGGLIDSFPIPLQEIESRLKYIAELKGRMLERERSNPAPLPSGAHTVPLPPKDDCPEDYDPRFD
jgi:hypothetical protein